MVHTLHIVWCCFTAEGRGGGGVGGGARSVCNDLTGPCSGAPALCGRAGQLSSPAPPAASADWPELQWQSPEDE